MAVLLRFRLLCAALLALVWAGNLARAQQSDVLQNYPRAQPFFDLPWQRRYDMCPAPPAEWECDPEGNGEDSGGMDGEDACTGDGCPNWMARRKCGFYFTSDYAPTFYDHNTTTQFARLGPAGPFALDTGNLPTELNSGGRMVMGCQLLCRLGIEGSFQGFYSYSDQAAVRDTSLNAAAGIGNLQSPFSNFGVPAVVGVDNNSLVGVSLQNRFNTADLNLRYLLDMPPGPFDITVLVGARFAKIDELFRYQSQTTTGAVVANDVAVTTRNELWGPQLGFVSSTLVTERFWIDFTAKGSLLHNAARQQTAVAINTNGQIANLMGTATAGRTAFLLDGILVGNYQLTEGLSFHAGYQAIWIDGAALGVANFQTNLAQLLAGPAQVNTGATAIYHGPVLGMTWAR